MFDNFLITQNSILYLAPIWILIIGMVINFSFCGLFKKHSRKISNITTILTLVLSLCTTLWILAGLTNENSIELISLFKSKILINKDNLLHCTMLNFGILATILTNLNHTKRLRHKTNYFNSLFLISTIAGNFLFLSNNFTIFLLSILSIDICGLYILNTEKSKNNIKNSFDFFLLSSTTTLLLIFSYAISNGFYTQDETLKNISFAMFFITLAGKSLLTPILSTKNLIEKNHTNFTYVNIFNFTIYSILFYNFAQNLHAQHIAYWLVIATLIISTTICTLKLLRIESIKNFIYISNSLIFCLIATSTLIISTKSMPAIDFAIATQIFILIGILNCTSILEFNCKKLNDLNLKGLYFTNPKFCQILNSILLIYCGLIPSGILHSRFLLFEEIIKNGLWCTIVLGVFTLCFCAILFATIKLITTTYKKSAYTNLSFKKRTKLNYFILFSMIILLVLLFI